VATAGSEGKLRVYELRTGRLAASHLTPAALQDVDFAADGKLLAAGGLGPDFIVWDVRRERLARTIHHGPAILTIRFSPDRETIATGDFAGNVDFWEAATGRKVGRTLSGQNGPVISVAYVRDGTELVTTSRDGSVRLWDLASGKLVGSPFHVAEAPGWGTAFPGGTRAIAAFASGTGVVWNIDPSAWAAQACEVAHRNLTRREWRDLIPERGFRRVCP
jgi:WD40 repeat protein